jgi:hypothetical protein
MGWNLFHAISHAAEGVLHKFEHIAKDLGPGLEVIAVGLGLPPGIATGAVDLLLGEHAGHAELAAHAAQVKARPEPWPTFLTKVAAAIHAHPDWAAFDKDAKKARTGAVVHGIEEALRDEPHSQVVGHRVPASSQEPPDGHHCDAFTDSEGGY